jgi:hypothetical protein
MAKFKSEFLADYYSRTASPLRAARLATCIGCRLGQPFRAALQLDRREAPGALDQRKAARIDARRTCPPGSAETFARAGSRAPSAASNAGKRPSRYSTTPSPITYDPEIGIAASKSGARRLRASTSCGPAAADVRSFRRACSARPARHARNVGRSAVSDREARREDSVLRAELPLGG